jgi:hypothetical protein
MIAMRLRKLFQQTRMIAITKGSAIFIQANRPAIIGKNIKPRDNFKGIFFAII